MTRRALIVLAILGAAGAAAVSMLRPRPQNVILVTIDTMRPDRISAYGYRRHQTPNLDRLAREGVLFENAFCDVTWTTPSMASVMTGTYATRHGMRSSFQTLRPGALTLAEILKNRGFYTAAIIASYPLHSIFGLNQGFDLYDEKFSTPLTLNDDIDLGPPEPNPSSTRPPNGDRKAMAFFLMDLARGEACRSDAAVSDRAMRWLRQERREPFFLWIHYFGPHEKPTGFAGLANIGKEQAIQLAAYDGDVLNVDHQIGRVLDTIDELGLVKNSVVVLHADHGQSSMEHGYFGHGRDILDPTAHIPLIIRVADGQSAGSRVAAMARNVDILPTVLGVLHVPNPVAGDGRDLFAPRPTSDEVDDYLETYLSATHLFAEVVDEEANLRVGFRRLGLRTAKWKFVLNEPTPFVDADFKEQRGCVSAATLFFGAALRLGERSTGNHERHRRERGNPDTMRRRVLALQPTGETESVPECADPRRERLRALGYLPH